MPFPSLKSAHRARIALLGGLILLTAGTLVPSRAEDIPHDLEMGLSEPLQARIKDLLAERNDDGLRFKRGSFSRNFARAGDSTYTTTFYEDIVENDRMTTHRYKVTLEPRGGNNWTLASQELQDTYDQLYRDQIDNEQVHSFKSFTFEREGLRVTATDGTVIKGFRNGLFEGFGISADDLAYEYTAPVEQDRKLYAVALEEHERDLEFEPFIANFSCSPAFCEELFQAGFTGLEEASPDSAHANIARAHRDYERQISEQRRENPFSGFGRLFEEGRDYLTVAVKRTGADEHWAWLRSDSVDGQEVMFGASGIGPLFRYYSDAARRSGVDPLLLERRDDAGDRFYDLQTIKGTVDLATEASESMSGDLEFRFRAKQDLKEVPFSIARISRSRSASSEAKNPSLTVNGVQDGDGNEVTWVKTGAVSGWIILPEPVPADGTFTLRMQFTNSDSIYKLTPSYSYVDRTGWLPFVAFGDMIDEVDLTMRIPAKFTALGIGKLISEEKQDGLNITRWKTPNPVNFPTVIYGDYMSANPKVKATKLDGSAIPVALHVDRTSMTAPAFVCTARDPDGSCISGKEWKIQPKQLKPLADDAANSLNLFREMFGVDYPFDKLDLVNDPIGPPLYGQSPASIVYLGNLAFMGEGTLATIGADASTTRFSKSLVAHEVGHQWWGSLIGNANQRHYWFIESLAEYAAAIFMQESRGAKSYKEHIDGWRKDVLESDGLVTVQNATTTWGGRYHQTNVYNKGPYVFHIMRKTFGDEKFYAFLKNLAQTLKFSSITTRDIQKVAEQTFGVNMEDFFDQWIRGAGVPELKVNYTTRKAEDGSYIVEGTVEQQVVVQRARHVLPDTYFLARMDLTAVSKQGKKFRHPIVVNGPSTSFKARFPSEPKNIRFNEDGEVLAHDISVSSAG